MKKIDILLVLEMKIREFDAMCLLKYELDRRGYVTEVVSTKYLGRMLEPKYECELVLGFVGFNNYTVDWNLGRGVRFKKAICIPWEQVLARGQWDKVEYPRRIDGIGVDVIVITWGNAFSKYVREDCNISGETVEVREVGNIGMDFCRREFNPFFLSREQLSQKYNLDKSKKWVFFSSTLDLCDCTEEKAAQYTREWLLDYTSHRKTQIKSRKMILSWIEKLLECEKDVLFIYRPHPIEAIDDELISMENRFECFRKITGESVKNWYKVCDYNYTWNSTSILEAYFLGVKCAVLRPYELEYDFQYQVMDGITCITSGDEFVESVRSRDGKFDAVLNKFLVNECIVSDGSPVYMKVCDLCEEVINNDEYLISDEYIKDLCRYQKDKFSTFSVRQKVRALIFSSDVLYEFYMWINEHAMSSSRRRSSEVMRRFFFSPEDVQSNVEKIRMCLE